KAVQARKGSREAYARVEQGDGWRTEIDPDFAAFLGNVDSFYLATASGDGQPYIQHRGGPKGFIKVLDEKTLGFADFAGNRQYITISNLAENNRAYLFLLDFARQRRIKLWGRARVVEDDSALLARLSDAGYGARPERAILFTIEAWDVNCSQHITARFTEDEIAQATAPLLERIAALETENARLRAAADANAVSEEAGARSAAP
ncbi:MAG TPA: pyridoxamine 5'-phosphate oxidase family protein, partial [Xanthobacteraceae bacterium]|nr:pyridoxamine 5'-phosphate oxidase family protein [Xanthobacteraceae bacterium]